MRNTLLAYLLDDLSSEERCDVEKKLLEDPRWQAELERLREYMPSDETPNQEAFFPPDDLADRTCSLINRTTSLPELPESQATRDALSESSETEGRTGRWSIADVMVGGGVLVAIALLVIPAMRESRDAARRSTCQNKLRTLGTALVEFAEQREQRLPTVDLGENAGIFVFKLAESGRLTRQELEDLLVCPESSLAEEVFAGRIVIRIPTRQKLTEARGAQLHELLKRMSGSYAYRLGYRDKRGAYRQPKFSGHGNSPLLADTPSFDVVGFQSANHGGCGQNVLFQDQSVRYCNECVSLQNKDHLFLNTAGEHAAGSHRDDVVLGRSETMPTASLAPSAR